MSSDRFFDLIRHGEPEGGGYFRGSLDDPLSEKGISQLNIATEHGTEWDVIISSPLKRCYDFAKQLSDKHQLPLIIDDSLRERHFGDWEGKSTTEINQADLELFWQEPATFTPPNAESLINFVTRSQNAWIKLKQQPYKKPLVITHGGIIRAFIGEVLSMPIDALLLLEVPYANISRIRVPEQGKDSLVYHHLPQANL